MPRRLNPIDLSPAVIVRLQRRRSEGVSQAALAAELGVGVTTLKKCLNARPANGSTGGSKTVPPEAKAHRTSSVPIRRRATPEPAEPERSKPALRAMLAEAFANTPHH